MSNNINRRDFLKLSVSSLAALGMSGYLLDTKETVSQVTKKLAIPTRPLGKTGHNATIFALGGQGTLQVDDEWDTSIKIINKALDLGVNYLDSAALYGPSQDYLGEVMKTRRKEVFLATKTHDRTRDGSLRLLDDSLKRLNTDHLDLWQLHNIRLTSQLDQIFGKGGAIEALEKARAEKMVRFFGITGHFDPFVLAEGIRRYPFDTILMALNAADKHHLSFIENLLPKAVEKKMGIIGMKVPAEGNIFRKNGVRNMEEAMGYVLTLPVSTIIVGCRKAEEVEENVKIAMNFKPFSEAKMKELEAKTKSYAEDASYFKNWG
ncbi:MAG TPA: aldo/keto reductase [candidate division Zixibacteria bacterium]|nr:aldo/keto reductase [candidate division Zixibacteria bacterium]